MSTFNSIEYTDSGSGGGTLGVLRDKREGPGIFTVLPFNWLVPSSPGTAPVVNLNIAPAGFKPIAVIANSDGLSASAGVNCTFTVGDSGSAARLATAIDLDVAGSVLIFVAAGFNYEYTSDTAIIATFITGKTPVTGQHLNGAILGFVRR